MKGNIIRMSMPSRWHDGLYREALPIGNGKTGALLLGSAGEEQMWINRCDRWHLDNPDAGIPDVHETLETARRLQKEGDTQAANDILAKALAEKGYKGGCGNPDAPAFIRVVFENEDPFEEYERGIDMSIGEAYAIYKKGGCSYRHSAFVSRAHDEVLLKIISEREMELKLVKPEANDFNIRVKTDRGEVEDRGKYIRINGCREFTMFGAFVEEPKADCYEAEFELHKPLHRAAMGDADLNLSKSDTFNEELLYEAFRKEASLEIYDKLWHFGRYVFACGTAVDGLPFPLYGLWHGTKDACWAQHVANENVEMIYWHTLCGGYAKLVKPLIHYYYGMMDVCRDAARKLFGTRGIFVSVYSSPVSFMPAPSVPVIVNYIGCAGWLSRHFYDYYLYTGDKELLRKEILPFMLEAAAFYEDYATIDENGRLHLAPSVSPENTPLNLMPEFGDIRLMGHPNPVVWDSTMDIAIMKELLTHLIELSREEEIDGKRVEIWKKMLDATSDYMINEDGAVKEWMDDELKDNYSHRHLSHIYPLFPGEEIRIGDSRFGAFEKAVDLRQLGSQSGWSLAHMSAIYCRMGRGDKALECLNIMSRSCLLSNFFTQHNDWRMMGLTLFGHDSTQLQLDALMGAVNAIQEMLLRADRNVIYLLPALPGKLAEGSFTNWHVPFGTVSAKWNRNDNSLSVSITANKETDFTLVLPEWCGKCRKALHIKEGETISL